MGPLKYLAAVLLMLVSIPAALADETSGNSHNATLAIYLAPHEYNQPVVLRHAYYTYWVNRGEIVAAVAQNTFRPMFREVSTCEGGNTADVIAWVRPQLFYNPLMEIYYADLKVNFYRADGKPIGTLKSKAQRNGFLDSFYYQRSYDVFADAFSKITDQLSQNTALQDAIRLSMAEKVAHAPCAIVGLVPNP